jgi:hypothetical protein
VLWSRDGRGAGDYSLGTPVRQAYREDNEDTFWRLSVSGLVVRVLRQPPSGRMIATKIEAVCRFARFAF